MSSVGDEKSFKFDAPATVAEIWPHVVKLTFEYQKYSRNGNYEGYE